MDFLRNIFRRRTARIPRKVLHSLKKHFPNAKNVEWNKTDDMIFEAAFYDEDIEKLAKFTSSGFLTEIRINTDINTVPALVRNSIDPGLEVMNCILVFTSENTFYELIVRNSELVRYLLIIDALGHVIRMEKL